MLPFCSARSESTHIITYSLAECHCLDTLAFHGRLFLSLLLSDLPPDASQRPKPRSGVRKALRRSASTVGHRITKVLRRVDNRDFLQVGPN